jgi:hypothetical protein
MVQPTWLADTLAGIMLGTSTYCLARLVAARRWRRTVHRDTNVAHLADGVAMSGMLVGALRTLPTGAWEVVFGAFTLWFAARGARVVARQGIAALGSDTHTLSHYLSHLVMAGAMLYMFVEISPTGTGTATHAMAMGVGSTSNLTELTLLLAIVLFVSAVWHADSLTKYTTAPAALVGAGAAVGAAPAPAHAAAEVSGGFDAQNPTDDDRAGDGSDTGQSRWLAPRLEMACHLALCITMGYMLVLLL